MNPFAAAGILESLQYLWWLWLFMVAYFFYGWAREHLAFSPMLTLVVAAILIYYLVIEYPIFGTMTLLTWTLISSGILYLLPIFLPFLKPRH